MALLDPQEQLDLVNMIAQAVVDRIEERERVNRLADLVVERVLSMQPENLPKKEENSDRF